MSLIPYPHAGKEPARIPLDRRRIVGAGLELLERVGLEGLTMRALAEALGVKAASLYRHVKDKEELLILLADEISAGLPLLPPGGTWQARARAMAASHRQALLARRDAGRVLAETPPMGPRRLQHVQVALEIFLSAGLEPLDAVRAAYHFNNLVTELVNDEMRLVQAARASGQPREALLRGMGQVFRDLPGEAFPVLKSLAGELSRDDFDGLFQFGMDVWIEGLERRRASPGKVPAR